VNRSIVGVALVVVAVGCGHAPTPVGEGGFPPATHHIDSVDDVRWPIERRTFVGTVRHLTAPGRATPVVVLELPDDRPVGPHRPALVALAQGLEPDRRVHVSGVGRTLAADEQAVGALISLGDVRLEPDDASGISNSLELEQAIGSTRVTAEGQLIERGQDFLMRLASDRYLRVVVVVEGVADIRSRVGKRVRAEGWLLDTSEGWQPAADILPGLALSQPMFSARQDARRQ
jgi:hypothetical protein